MLQLLSHLLIQWGRFLISILICIKLINSNVNKHVNKHKLWIYKASLHCIHIILYRYFGCVISSINFNKTWHIFTPCLMIWFYLAVYTARGQPTISRYPCTKKIYQNFFYMYSSHWFLFTKMFYKYICYNIKAIAKLIKVESKTLIS